MAQTRYSRVGNLVLYRLQVGFGDFTVVPRVDLVHEFLRLGFGQSELFGDVLTCFIRRHVTVRPEQYSK